jgi:hypothetical protein
MNLLEPEKLFRESADHAGVVVKFLHTSRAFSVLHVIDWFRHILTTPRNLPSSRENPSLVAILDPKGFRKPTLDIPVSETLEQIVAVATTGKRKHAPQSRSWTLHPSALNSQAPPSCHQRASLKPPAPRRLRQNLILTVLAHGAERKRANN